MCEELRIDQLLLLMREVITYLLSDMSLDLLSSRFLKVCLVRGYIVMFRFQVYIV